MESPLVIPHEAVYIYKTILYIMHNFSVVVINLQVHLDDGHGRDSELTQSSGTLHTSTRIPSISLHSVQKSLLTPAASCHATTA